MVKWTTKGEWSLIALMFDGTEQRLNDSLFIGSASEAAIEADRLATDIDGVELISLELKGYKKGSCAIAESC